MGWRGRVVNVILYYYVHLKLYNIHSCIINESEAFNREKSTIECCYLNTSRHRAFPVCVHHLGTCRRCEETIVNSIIYRHVRRCEMSNKKKNIRCIPIQCVRGTYIRMSLLRVWALRRSGPSFRYVCRGVLYLQSSVCWEYVRS